MKEELRKKIEWNAMIAFKHDHPSMITYSSDMLIENTIPYIYVYAPLRTAIVRTNNKEDFIQLKDFFKETENSFEPILEDNEDENKFIDRIVKYIVKTKRDNEKNIRV